MSEKQQDEKIAWIDNLRAVACLMVIMIHTTSYYVTQGLGVGEHYWILANTLNSASRVAVPVFFMISGYLFFGERQARGKHYLRIALCLLFYSVIGLTYMSTLTPINALQGLEGALQKPVFYHLWFFYAITMVYLLSPYIRVNPVPAGHIALLVILLAVIANPNTPAVSVGHFSLLPANLYLNGDTFYYVLYALLGRAMGLLAFSRARRTPLLAAAAFALCALLIALGTKRQMAINGDFADTYYDYCGPLVFIGAISLLVLFKTAFNRRVPVILQLISRHSLAIYGFHAFIIHYLRTHGLDIKSLPALDIVYIFSLTLLVSLLLAIAVARIDRRRLVS
ncbi:acyltransferase [Biostraticola tofi]|uniref:O-acetyltransferase WecH n=1 Tax=Biostraticola tofi TaxID=466109 RepID=A0A4R3YSP2_9GAMM|nr:acyltransferase [Biostraticola tofi]TCV95511.1 surface polysaccharide O-acyltransferase-like enzyme [Biostraticola tofi]